MITNDEKPTQRILDESFQSGLGRNYIVIPHAVAHTIVEAICYFIIQYKKNVEL